jgi:hypothetical protein
MQADARATGFWLGSHGERCPDVIGAWRASGNNVGLHSWSHNRMPKLDDATFSGDTQRAVKVVRDATHTTPDGVYRFPYGLAASRETAALRELGFEAFFWSVDTNDWRGRSGDQVEASAAGAGPGGIVLMHDTEGAIDAARSLVADLRGRGLEPVTLSALGATYYAQPRVWFPGPVHVAPKDAPPAPVEASGGSSADGRWVAMASRGALYLFDTAAASGLRVSGGVAAVAWAPGVDALAVESTEQQHQVYVLAPDVTAAVQAGKAADSLGQVPTAVRVSASASSNGSPRFSADGKSLYWDRVGPTGRRSVAYVTLRSMAPWAVASVTSRPSGAEVSLTMGGRAYRGTTPCRMLLPRVRQATTVSATVTAPGLAERPVELTLTPGATTYADVALDTPDSASGESAVASTP